MRLSFYRHLSFIVFLCSGFALMEDYYIIGAIIFFVGIGVAYGYRCHFCGNTFDIRLGKSKLQHCPRCGERINW